MSALSSVGRAPYVFTRRRNSSFQPFDSPLRFESSGAWSIVKRTLIGSIVPTLVLLVTSAFGQIAPTAGSWAQIPNTALYPATPFEAKLESSAGATLELWNRAGVFAYSGAALGTLNGGVGFLYWGGGHGDTYDNSLSFAPSDRSGPRGLSGPYLAPHRVHAYDAPWETYRSISRNAPTMVRVSDSSAPVAEQMPTPRTTASTMPVRTWIERPLLGWGGIGKSYMPNGGKHGRTFYHSGLKQMVFAGGDWRTAQPNDGNFVGSEIWALDVAHDTWTQLRPFCVPGAVQPGRPDNVVWAYDSKRDRGLMAPGFYGITQGANAGCGAKEGWGGYAFDFTTKQFTGPNDAAGLPAPPEGGWGGDEGAAWGVYDPVNDELVRVRNGMRLERLNLGAKTWRIQRLSDPGGTTPHRSQQVIDVKGRAVFFLAPFRKPPALIRVSLNGGSVTTLPLPPQYRLPDLGGTETYLVFDNINRVLLIPNNFGMGQTPIQGLGIYHVDTDRWEWEAVPPAVAGSVWGFDEATGAIIGIGKRNEPFAYFLYKYDPSAQAPTPLATQRWLPAAGASDRVSGPAISTVRSELK